MRKKRGSFVPRGIDRAIFAILAILHMANGAYLIGPWYLPLNDAKAAPMYELFNSENAVIIYGIAIFINGVVLLYLALTKYARKYYAKVLAYTLLSAFFMRLYSLIGVIIVLDSWRPPGYLSHMASVLIVGAYWIWVRVDDRTIQ